MCRWITLLSSEQVALSTIVTAPSNGLIQLSKDASYHPGYGNLNNHRMNGDGFGIGWYHNVCPPDRRSSSNKNNSTNNSSTNNNTNNNSNNTTTTALFKDTQPAWNNSNLRELCQAIESHCIVAHVRAASSFAPITEPNCHPFKAGRLLFCHNGRCPNFHTVKRTLMNQLSDEAFVAVRGNTGSEVFFALIVTYLSQDVKNKSTGETYGSAYQQEQPFGHKRLTHAVKRALRTIEETLATNDPDHTYATFNFCLTDGETVVVTRYCDQSPHVPPPSLYFAFGDAQTLEQELINEEADIPFSETTGEEKKEDSDSEDDDGTDREPEPAGTTNRLLGDEEEEDNMGRTVPLVFKLSAPGKIYADIDRSSASFLVSSCPLTRTHTWHPLPKNSIMWYTRGSFPELRLLLKPPAAASSSPRSSQRLMTTTTTLTDAAVTHLPPPQERAASLIMMPPPTPHNVEMTPDGLIQVMDALKQHI